VYDFCHVCKNDNLVAPEIHSYDEYMDKKEEDYDAWYTEQMQDAQRKEGGMISPEDIHWVRRPFWKDGVNKACTAVDCADTLDEANDFVGIVSCLSQTIMENKRASRRFIFYDSDVARRLARNSEVKEKKKPCDWVSDDGKRIVRGIIETVQLHCDWWLLNYPNTRYSVAWERNKSGIAILEQALREYRNYEMVEVSKDKWVPLTWPRYLSSEKADAVKWEKDRTCNVVLGITHRTDKETRIVSGLKYSIIEGQSCFTENLRGTVFMEQLLHYPKGKHDDGPDAAEMAKDDLNRSWSKPAEPRKPIEIVEYERKLAKAAKAFSKFKYGGVDMPRSKPRRII
jgi:hypothetical protein